MQTNKSYSILNDNDENIRAVQRLRDGLIFNLGDLVNLNQDQEFPIISFKEGTIDIIATFERKTHSVAKNTILLENLVVLKNLSKFTVSEVAKISVEENTEKTFITKDGKKISSSSVCWLLVKGIPTEKSIKSLLDTNINPESCYSNKKSLLAALCNYEIKQVVSLDGLRFKNDSKHFNDRNYKIHKVERRSDKKLLTVGDLTEFGIIVAFTKYENQIRITTENGIFALNMFNGKTFVLKTNDDVNIFIGDTYYWFDLKYKQIIRNHVGPYILLPFKFLNEPRYRFSTREAAADYLEKLKKERSVLFISEDGKEIFNGDDYWLTKEKHSTEVFYHKGDQVLTYFSTAGVKRFSTRKLAEEYIESLRKVYLVTGDNFSLHLGDTYYFVSKIGNSITPLKISLPVINDTFNHYRRFALKENAEKYRDSLVLVPKTEKKYTISELEKFITSPQMRANALIKQLKDAR